MWNLTFLRLMRLVVLLVTVTGCSMMITSDGGTTGGGSGGGGGGSTTGGSAGMPAWGVRHKTSGCRINGKYPDKDCTPGDIFPNATAADVCQSGYSRGVRNVPQAEKDQVYAEYGIASHVSGEYEVDHFVSLELGGSNDISNLWSEPANPQPGFHEKDKVENYLHDQVCNGAMTLQEAQREIATDWYAVYKHMIG
jgi:hypothetical protein